MYEQRMFSKFPYTSSQRSPDSISTSIPTINSVERKLSSSTYKDSKWWRRHIPKEKMITIKRILQNRNGSTYIISASTVRKRRDKKDNKKIDTVSLPYVKEVSEDIQNFCDPYNIKVIFRISSPLRKNHCLHDQELYLLCGKEYKCAP